jgi:hypothetical protein
MTAPHDRTADQFDAWLETASHRHSRPASPNGATDPAAYDLVIAAHEFHASIRAAEQRVVSAIPAKAIWEDVMSSTTSGTISIPALAPSGANSPPKSPARPTADSPWPKPGHWAVPAFLVVAAMIGILWFYSSFFGTSTTPESTPTLQPGFAFSTPTGDINEWLVAPDDIDCGSFGTPDPNSTGFDLGQNTSASIDVEAYLPFGEAPALEQRPIAERYMLLGAECPRAATDTGVADDAFMMPFDYASDDQVAAAQQISAAMPNQDYREYFILQPSLDTTGEDRQLSRTVVLPGDVIQLADGRLGVPARFYLVGQTSVLDVTGGREYASTMFLVFDRVDGHWLVDEIIQVCIGECDEYWAVLAGDLPADTLATPLASPATFSTPTEAPVDPATPPAASPDIATPTVDIDEWLVDPAAYACEQGFSATVTPESRPVDGWPTDRPMDVDDYLPLTAAPAADQRAIAERFLQMNTNCLPTSDDPVISEDFHWMPGPSVASATADQVETAQKISAALPMQDYRDYFIIQPPSLGTPVPGESTSTMNGSGVLLPQDVMQLPDGRIGAPLRFLIESDDPDGAIHAMTGGRDVATPVFLVFEREGDRWLYDELFLLCFGDCDEYWAVVAGDLPVDNLATPVATPAPSSTASLQPITASECTVEGLSQDEVSAIIRDAPETPYRSWVPVGPVDPVTAGQVSQTDRAWQACNAFGSIGQRTVFQTDYLTSTGPERDFDQARTDEDIQLWFERFEQRRDLGNAFLSSIEETYLPTTQAVVETYGTGSDTLPSGQRVSLPVPDAAILLADGRIALPISVPMTTATWEENQSPDSDFPYIYMPVHILEFDSDSNSWLVDEVIEVCVGDCDAALARISEWANYNGIAVPGTPATSPVTIDDSLLDPGECTVTPLTNEEISALQQDPGSYPAREYGPTSPVDDRLSGEIAELDREFQACANDGNWRSMASQRLIYETRATGNYAQIPTITAPRGLTGDEYIAWHRDLSTTLLPGDISDYVVLSDWDIATMTGYVVQPHQVVQLSDGRIGAPQSLVLPDNYDVGGIPSIIMSFNVYIQESAMNDRWVLDESLLLCVGECDMFYEQMSRDLSILPASTPFAAASPVATPAASQTPLHPTQFLIDPNWT